MLINTGGELKTKLNSYPLLVSLCGCAEAETGFAILLRFVIFPEVLTSDTGSGRVSDKKHSHDRFAPRFAHVYVEHSQLTSLLLSFRTCYLRWVIRRQ